MHIIIAPGSFKHSLSATQAAKHILSGLKRAVPQATLSIMPIADGGNGTLDAFLVHDGERKSIAVENPFGQMITADYGLIDKGNTAVIEMALASGIELIERGNPMRASTYGTGQLLQSALETGVKRFIVGMGGSATVDGGAGCLQALGVKLLKSNGSEIARGAAELHRIETIDTDELDPRWNDVEVIIACDVDNPLLGPQGAAAVFGPQKGASPDDVLALERGLAHFYSKIYEQHGVDVRNEAGAGAAGGLSAGLMAFLGGRLQSGIDLILTHSHFDELLKSADLVITGEGQMDDQTVHGKGPIGVAHLAKQHGVPTIAIVGGLNTDDVLLHEAGIDAVLPIVTGPMSLSEAISEAGELVERTALRLGYILAINLKRSRV